MATERLSAELEIHAGLAPDFKRAFDKLDERVNAASRKLGNIGKAARFDGSQFNRATRQIDRATRSWDSSFTRVFSGFRTKFARATDTAVTYLKRKMGRASMAIGKQLEFQPTVNYRGPPRLTAQGGQKSPLPNGPKDGTRSVPATLAAAAGGFAIAGIRQLPAVFKDTNVQLMEAQENMRGLKRQSKNYEELARHARSMDKAVSPWLRKIDRVNSELAVQEKRIDHLRVARARLNRAERQFREFRSRVAPLTRTAGFAAVGAAASGGYALARGAQQFANFDQVMRVLQAEGVSEVDIPLIREQVFRLAETTQFTDIEIAEVLVGMKKDGQAVTAELTGVSDVLKLAVAESRSLESAWAATRTLINTTGTDLANAIKLQEQMSNATSVSALNMEQLQYIAGQSLSIYKGIAAFDSADFLALSGALGGILRPERIATGLREFSLTLADAAAGNLSASRQEAFDLLNLNITDEEGKLKDAVSILKEFETAFSRPEFLDAQGKIIGDKVQPILARIFGREALPTVANLLFKSEQIAANIAAINTPGTLDRKAAVMEASIDAATNRLKSAVSVLSQRFFEALDGDGNFNAMLDSMSSKVQQLSAWLTENRAAIQAGFKRFTTAAANLFNGVSSVVSRLFDYLHKRGPAIRAFLTDFWTDLQGVWRTLKPVVMGVLAGLRELLELVSRLGAGNTKLLAWLTAASVGFFALKTPILAVNAAVNTVIGTIHKLRAAYAGMSAVGSSWGLPDGFPKRRGFKPRLPAEGAGAETVRTARRSGFPTTIKSLVGKVPSLLSLLNIGAIFPALAKIGPAIGAAFSALLPTLGAIGAKIAAIGPAVLGVLGGITAPVAAVIAAVVLVVGSGVALIVANWDKVKRAFWSTIETVKLLGSTAWEILKFVGGSIVDFFRNIGPNVQAVVSAIGSFTTNTFKAVGDFLIRYLGPVGEGIVTIFSGIFNVVGWAATKTWTVLKTVGIAVGGFFKTVFGGIVGGIKASVTWLKEKVGQFFDWVTRMNEKVQNILRKIRNFFRQKNEEREAARTELKAQGIELDVAVPRIPAQTVDGNLRYTPIPGMETAQEFYLKVPERFPEVPELKIETPEAPILETPEAPILQTPAAPILQTPAAPTMEMPEVPTVEMPETARRSVPATMEMPAVPAVETARRSGFPTTMEMGAVGYSPAPTTVEYVDFASVDEIDKTLKAGFKSLLDVNSAILVKLGGAPVPVPEKTVERITEKTRVLQTERTEIQRAEKVREVFEREPMIIRPDLDMPAMPDLDMPPAPALEMPAMPDLEMPAMPALEMPPAPAVETARRSVPATVETARRSVPATVEMPGVPPLVVVEMPADLMDTERNASKARLPIGENLSVSPPPVVSMPAPRVQVDVREQSIAPIVPPTPAQRHEQVGAGNTGGTTEITNNITIHQQPGEDAEMLTARILRELERRHRTEAYQ